MKYPKISIITPSYNQGNFLEETIQSVLNQSYPDLEYIIIDGGSTDNSVEIIKKYENRLTYWVSERDKGQTDAINKGIRRSTGEIIGWMNSDDFYLPRAFFKVAKVFQKRPECIVVYSDRLFLNKEGRVVGWSALPPFDPQKSDYNVGSETAFWRREASDRIGELNTDLQFAMDVEFFSRLYQIGPFCKVNGYLGCFRGHDASKSSTIQSVGIEEAIRVWTEIFGPRDENFRAVPPSYLAHRMKILRHPFLIGFPFLSYKAARFLRLKK